ncbi:DUF1934 domain-containing protein [Paenibacillus hunanensis]|uniref:Uncharacterized beta-barrel protein YwiB (DUF1934 family) n=1 Tax=Paenibacillus hunanensis TaxID=539262 RepID=A0ABU1J4I3_9BACL|nr:DUF1934 domain-containing protein [Paenibacillus hunanensis]MDR6246415.1 uncharacterized beta-barrel protein YwiB (DUF1934 family) [Paenibacillus hunanensis]WPP41483.1 DUF1934 domain-containing protein [Paenibacillus hunanensis]GGJ31423.1 hypothetical protein GCM10008022_45130 [Paenibacillus hunanensis]
MTETNEVRLTLRSEQDGEVGTTHMVGQVFAKGNNLYIRYAEPPQPPQQEIRTTVKISNDEIKIMRHGGVESEQTFRPGEQLLGFYQSPFTRFEMETYTRSLHHGLNGITGHIAWEYDLYVHEQLSGRFKVSLHIQANDESPDHDSAS